MVAPFDLSVDAGELPDEPEGLFEWITTANVACGGHAGDRATVRRTLERARRSSVAVVAHPSYPDRAGFGRTRRWCSPSEVEGRVGDQLDLLLSEASAARVPVLGIKPHGGLYHDAASDPDVAQALLSVGIARLGISAFVVGLGGSILQALAIERGVPFRREGFVDRGYGSDGQLLARDRPGALLESVSACVDQARRLSAEGRFETLCLHGDHPLALEVARAVSEALDLRTFGPT